MKNKRLHRAARELHISSEALIKLLRSLGFRVKGYTSFVSDEMIAACKKKMEEDKKFLKAQDRKRERIKAKRKEEKERKKERKLMERKRAAEKVKETLVKLETKERVKRKKSKPPKREEEKLETKKISVGELTSVRELAQMLNTEPLDLIAKCLELGLTVTINQRLDFDTVATIADEYGYETELMSYYVEEEVEEEEEGEEIVRPPIVTVMGHVDHGKTSVLDYIRKTNVTRSESGGITQHIGAYEIDFKGKKITFIDTPGHEAFTAMRARGAQVTDVAVLVVAADDGVMPQTVESINHAKDAGIPIIVAINKMDLPNANPEKTKQELLHENVRLEEYGGDVPVCLISAKTGEGIPELLETMLIQADLLELTATKGGLVKGTIIESKKDKGKGIVATVLVLQGTLKKGDAFIAGITSGKVRAMYDEWGVFKEYCEPGSPVQVVGFDKLPNIGDSFVVVEDEKKAREISRSRETAIKEQIRREKRILTLEGVQKELAAGKMKELKIIIKGDVAGSVEAISDSLEELVIKNIKINVIHKPILEQKN
jgi:translation initiation factor IF-2